MFNNLASIVNGLSKHKLISGKILLLLVMLLVGGLTVLGCGGVGMGAQSKGWSGGVIANGALFLGSMEGRLVAIDTSSRGRLWPDVTLETSAPAGGFGCAPGSTSVAIYGTPAVAGELVYVAGYDGKIRAFKSSSGALRWVYPREGNLGESIVGGTVVSQGRVYFGCSDGKVYALEATTGDKEWEFQTGGKVWSTPVIDGDTLFIGSFDKKLYALNASTGKEKWEFETGGAIVSAPVVDNNTVYIGSFDRHLYAVAAASGKQIWEFPVDDEDENKPENWFWAKPIAYNDVIYAPCLDGKVYAVDAKNGDKVAEFDLGSPISSLPVLVNSSIVIASEEGRLYTLDTSSNQIRELVNLEEEIYAPLYGREGVVYIHTEKDTLYAVDAQSGVMLWSIPLKS